MPIYMELAAKMAGDGSVRPGLNFMGDGSVRPGLNSMMCDGSVRKGTQVLCDGSVRVAVDADLQTLLPALRGYFGNRPIGSVTFHSGGVNVLIGLLLPAVQSAMKALGTFMAPNVSINFRGITDGTSIQHSLIGFLPAGAQFGQAAF